MSDIRATIKLISGKEPTPEQVQRVQAIAHTCGFSANDAMMPILIALDVYHGAFNELPGRAQQAADAIARNAGLQTKAVIEQTVADSLKPEAIKAFEEGVLAYKDVLENSALKTATVIVLTASVVILGIGIIVGWAGGSWTRANNDQTVIDAATLKVEKLQAEMRTDCLAGRKLSRSNK